MPDRPYTFLDLTNSVCATCLKKVEAKLVLENGCIFMLKNCLEHGREKVLISTDYEYYKLSRGFLKPGQMPLHFNTKTEHGCPYDCGLCPDHEQHSCLTLIEITDRCNLECPVCYAESGPTAGKHRSLDQVILMLDSIVRNEGAPDVVQISGGEPTIHPDFWQILDLAKQRPIKHLMVNTNGIRIAKEKDFCKRLAEYMPGFEVYLQFDSLRKEPLLTLRGVDLIDIRKRAIDNLNEAGISTTLVVTVSKGHNDNELGKIIEFALKQPAVRGITFQPVQHEGRTRNYSDSENRLTLSEVRRKILEQCDVLAPDDILPVPCHPDCIAMAYALKYESGLAPLSRFFGPDVLLKEASNTIQYEADAAIRQKLIELFSLGQNGGKTSHAVGNLLCCLPNLEYPTVLSYKNIFRLIIMEFMDKHNLDVRSVKRSCVHIVHPDGRIIPFDTFNMFYRSNMDVAALSQQTSLVGIRS